MSSFSVSNKYNLGSNYRKLGRDRGLFKSKYYLSYKVKDDGVQWKIKKLNFIEKFFRSAFGAYKSTHLTSVVTTLSAQEGVNRRLAGRMRTIWSSKFDGACPLKEPVMEGKVHKSRGERRRERRQREDELARKAHGLSDSKKSSVSQDKSEDQNPIPLRESPRASQSGKNTHEDEGSQSESVHEKIKEEGQFQEGAPQDEEQPEVKLKPDQPSVDAEGQPQAAVPQQDLEEKKQIEADEPRQDADLAKADDEKQAEDSEDETVPGQPLAAESRQDAVQEEEAKTADVRPEGEELSDAGQSAVESHIDAVQAEEKAADGKRHSKDGKLSEAEQPQAAVSRQDAVQADEKKQEGEAKKPDKGKEKPDSQQARRLAAQERRAKLRERLAERAERRALGLQKREGAASKTKRSYLGPEVSVKTLAQKFARQKVNFEMQLALIQIQDMYNYRSIAGDGHCMFRAIAAGVALGIIQNPGTLPIFYEKIDGHLDLIGASDGLREAYAELKKSLNKIETGLVLEDIIRDVKASDNFVKFLRLLACEHNNTFRDSAEAFVDEGERTIRVPLVLEGKTVKDEKGRTVFTDEVIDFDGYLLRMKQMDDDIRMGGHVELDALAESLGLNIQVVNLSGVHTQGDASEIQSEYNNHSPSSIEPLIDISLLFRPGHYDLAIPLYSH